MVSFLWPWGLSLLLTEGQKVLKLFEVGATPMMGVRIKKKTKEIHLIHHSAKGVIPESPCVCGLSIWLNFHLKN